MRGGRDLFHLLPEAFKGIKQIGVIGWGSQVYRFSFTLSVILFCFGLYCYCICRGKIGVNITKKILTDKNARSLNELFAALLGVFVYFVRFYMLTSFSD